MAISKERKEALVEQYVTRLQRSKGIIIVRHAGMNMGALDDTRRTLREVDASFTVVKNTLWKIALQEVGLPVSEEWMSGSVAAGFIYGEVPAAAKTMADIAKKYSERMSIIGGLLDGRVISPEQVSALSSLPSREVMLARVLGTINAPASQVVGVVASGIRQIVNVLQAHVDKMKEGEAGPLPEAA